MLRIRKSDLDRALEYWRLRCESYEGEETVPIYLSSRDKKERKECHLCFSDDGKSLLVIEDNDDEVSERSLKELVLIFSEHRSFGEGDETLTVPHRDYFMNRFTKGE